MIPKIDKYNWGYVGFLAIMQACKNSEFLKFVEANEEKEESEKFHFSIYDGCEKVFYIYRHENKWKLWGYTEKESDRILLERKIPIVIVN